MTRKMFFEYMASIDGINKGQGRLRNTRDGLAKIGRLKGYNRLITANDIALVMYCLFFCPSGTRALIAEWAKALDKKDLLAISDLEELINNADCISELRMVTFIPHNRQIIYELQDGSSLFKGRNRGQLFNVFGSGIEEKEFNGFVVLVKPSGIYKEIKVPGSIFKHLSYSIHRIPSES